MFEDYHVHLDKSDWSVDTIKEMCSMAEMLGVDRIGLVIHTRILKGFEPLYAHLLSDGKKHDKLKFDRNIDEYLDVALKAKRSGLPIDVGIEVCYSPDGETFLRKKLMEYPFDFIIGSVHLIGNMHYKTAMEKYKDTDVVGNLYYNLVLKAVNSRLFDIIGHMEVARREGILGLDHYPDLLDKIAHSLKCNDCALEINTKWLVKRDYIVPEHGTLTYMARAGVKPVFGSDAHHKERIGFARDIAYNAIKKAGFTEFASMSTTT